MCPPRTSKAMLPACALKATNQDTRGAFRAPRSGERSAAGSGGESFGLSPNDEEGRVAPPTNLEISHLFANLTNCLFLQLANSLARQVVLVTDFLERQLVLLVKAKAPTDDVGLNGRQGG